jgi:hypothetical protein
MFNKRGLNTGQIIGIVTVFVTLSIIIVLQLTGTINLLQNQQDLCPGIGNRTFCGICNLDKKLSDNPNAGQCSICPAGTICSGDVCGEMKCIPYAEMHNRTEETPTNLIDVPYTTKSGMALVARSAFPGYVHVITEDIIESDAIKEFERLGGRVESSDPDLGVFLIKVDKGSEGKFLSEVFKKDWVVYGIPTAPPSLGTISIHDFFSDRSAFQSKKKWDCGNDHGNIVEKVASRYSGNIEVDELPLDIETDPEFMDKMLKRMKNRIIKANKNCENIVFSLSLQSRNSGLAYSKVVRSGCTGEYDCEGIREGQKAFYTMFLNLMDKLYKKDPKLLDNVIIVIIAGNAGTDLDRPISEVREEYPIAFDHLLIVGGTTTSSTATKSYSVKEWDYETEINLYDNHLRNYTLVGNSLHPNMVYVNSHEVPVFLDENGFETDKARNGCSGTSYAAPQVAAAVEYIWKQTPELTAKELMESFDRAMFDIGNAGIIPQKMKKDDKYISPAFLDYAIGVSKTKISDKSLTGLWEGTLISKHISEEGWTCITDTNNPIRVCMQQKCKNVTGYITFPEGLKSTTTSPEEGAFCPPSVPIPCGGGESDYCSEFVGKFDGKNIKFEYFALIGSDYIPSPGVTDKVKCSAAFVNNRTTFNFSSYGSSGTNSRSITNGTFTVKKIANKCK